MWQELSASVSPGLAWLYGLVDVAVARAALCWAWHFLADSRLVAWLDGTGKPVLDWLLLGWNIQPLIVLFLLVLVLFVASSVWKILKPSVKASLVVWRLLWPYVHSALRAAPVHVLWFAILYSLVQTWGRYIGDSPATESALATAAPTLQPSPGGAGYWMQILDAAGRPRMAWIPGT